MHILIAVQRALVEDRLATARQDLARWLRAAQLGSQPSLSEIRAAADALTAAAIAAERISCLESQLRMLEIVAPSEPPVEPVVRGIR